MDEGIVLPSTQPMSQDITALAQAFLLAKREFVATGKSGNNTRYGKYAKIEDIYHAVEDALSKQGIIIIHYAQPNNGIEYLHTRLIHAPTGQYIEDCRILFCEAPGNQEKGKANTYMKKYAVLSLCAIPTEDDDGESEKKFIDEPYITAEDVVALNKALQSHKDGEKLRKDIHGYNKVRDISELKQSQLKGVKDHINKNWQKA